MTWVGDSLKNLITGMGTGRDKTMGTHWVAAELTDAALTSAHRCDWVARKTVDIPLNDMLREGWLWQADKVDIGRIEAEEKRLGIEQALADACLWARLYGGAALILGDGATDPSMPLNVERVRRGGLRYVNAIERRYITPSDVDRDPMSPGYGEPYSYRVSGAVTGEVTLHPSRVIPLHGAPRADRMEHSGAMWWGDSVLLAVQDAVRNAGMAPHNLAGLLAEAKVDVIKIRDLGSYLQTAASTQRLTERFQLADIQKSLHNLLLLGEGEEWDRKEISWAGLPDVVKTFLLIASAAADIPVTRFLGQSPAGLTATGESDIRNYYDGLAGRRQRLVGSALARLDEVLLRSALGARPADVWRKWPPLWQPTPVESADIALKRAQATQIYVNTGLLPTRALAKAVANQLIEDGAYAGLEAALEEEGPGEDDVEPAIADPAEEDSAEGNRAP